MGWLASVCVGNAAQGWDGHQQPPQTGSVSNTPARPSAQVAHFNSVVLRQEKH